MNNVLVAARPQNHTHLISQMVRWPRCEKNGALMKIFQALILAFFIGFSGWIVSTVYALDKSYDLVEFRLELVEENYNMLKDLWEDAGHGR